jgi:hypothetical protein
MNQAATFGGGNGRNFSVALVAGVASRCPHGAPRVLLCRPLRGCEPFPTSFWLSCPHLLRVAARIEGRNGVSGMEDFLSRREADWRRYNLLHAVLRMSMIPLERRKFMRLHRRRIYESLRLRGVGGVSCSPGPIFVKCVHLQVASYLGMGCHPASEWIERNIEEWSCEAGVCMTERSRGLENPGRLRARDGIFALQSAFLRERRRSCQ